MQTASWTQQDGTFAAGTVAGGWRANVTSGGAGVATQDLPASATSAQFDLTAAGTYIFGVQRLDSGGNPLQAVVQSAPFVITAPAPVTISIAAAVTVA